ncbi:hypothetical protein AB0M68_03470 [Streptomyces sp. NPDC051453]|uniref:hypothetical protein n=1 Tax=Streptomyces sp. NPDC051453 TaxID=3154941 RepID=UPI003413FD98
MTGRRRTYTRPCSTTGCRETSTIEYTARRDIEGVSKTWTCRHHDKPNETLSLTNRETEAVLALHQNYRDGYMPGDPPKLVGHFWGPEDAARGSHGIVSGPGFWAEAKRFPPGTRLIVTARIVLPDDTTEETSP